MCLLRDVCFVVLALVYATCAPPTLGFQSVNSCPLQCLFDKCGVPFLPLEVLVSIADCPVRLCFCVTVLSFLTYPVFWYCYCMFA